MTQPAAPAAQTAADVFRALMMQMQDAASLDDEVMSSLPVTAKEGPYETGQPFPGRPDYIIVRLFVGAQGERSTEGAHVAGELRAYCLPKEPSETATPVRYTVRGLGTPTAIVRTDNMTFETWVEEAGHELVGMAVAAGLIDDLEEGEDCPNDACAGSVKDDDKFCSQCGMKLEEQASNAVPAAMPPIAQA
jgi:hypothetical protein